MTPVPQSDQQSPENQNTYNSRDGYVRTRCFDHVARHGPHAVNEAGEIILIEPDQPAHRCIECFYAWIDERKQHDA